MADDLRRPLIRHVHDPDITQRAQRSDGGSRCTMFSILVTVCLERAAYYTLLGNLAVFLNTEMLWSPVWSSGSVLAFYGFTWISCFIGGIVGDVSLGRFNTIGTGIVLYVLGYISLPLISLLVVEKNINGRKYYMYCWLCFTLILISLGEGFFKSNMAPFGADQISRAGEKKLRSFFSIFYWSINIGGLLGFGPMSLLLERGKSFRIGYTVAVGGMALAGFVFLLPKRYLYNESKPQVNVIKRIWVIVKDAIRSKRRRQQVEGTTIASYEDFVPTQHWLDRAMVKYGGTHLDIEVEEVKALCRILPTYGFLVVYCSLYYQVTGTFLMQGLNMNTKVWDTGTDGKSMPAAFLSLFNIVFVLIFVPIVDKLLYPLLEKCGIKISHQSRMAAGMILASVAMVLAGLVEMKRINTHGTVVIEINDQQKNATNMSILYQIPQYGVMGISEIFVLITGLEFAYTNSPKSMQSIVTGLFFMANGLGSFLGLLMIAIAGKAGYGLTVSSGETSFKNVLSGKLYYFFFFLAVLNAVNWLLFVVYIGCKRRKAAACKRGQKSIEQFMKDSGMRSWKTYNSLEHPS